jgi:putative transposase
MKVAGHSTRTAAADLMADVSQGALGRHRAVRQRFREAGIRVVLTPERAPNANAHAERCVRSIKEECLGRMIPLGERHFRRAMTEFVEHDHLERNHQGLDNRLIMRMPVADTARPVRRRSRLGGLLNYYERAA